MKGRSISLRTAPPCPVVMTSAGFPCLPHRVHRVLSVAVLGAPTSAHYTTLGHVFSLSESIGTHARELWWGSSSEICIYLKVIWPARQPAYTHHTDSCVGAIVTDPGVCKVWGHLWKGSTVWAHCDNSLVAQVTSRGMAKEPLCPSLNSPFHLND